MLFPLHIFSPLGHYVSFLRDVMIAIHFVNNHANTFLQSLIELILLLCHPLYLLCQLIICLFECFSLLLIFMLNTLDFKLFFFNLFLSLLNILVEHPILEHCLHPVKLLLPHVLYILTKQTFLVFLESSVLFPSFEASSLTNIIEMGKGI